MLASTGSERITSAVARKREVPRSRTSRPVAQILLAMRNHRRDFGDAQLKTGFSLAPSKEGWEPNVHINKTLKWLLLINFNRGAGRSIMECSFRDDAVVSAACSAAQQAAWQLLCSSVQSQPFGLTKRLRRASGVSRAVASSSRSRAWYGVRVRGEG